MKLILLGAPGPKKGTVAKTLTKTDGSVQISTGDILRGAVQAGTELGKEAEDYMNLGDLVPDSLIMGIMGKRLQEPNCQKGFLLHGFPRTIPQAEAMKELLAKLSIKVVQRADETEEAIAHRLDTCNKKTAPLAGFYEKKGLLKTITGTSSDLVVNGIKKELGM
jgi:adenylate kinase